MKTKIISSLIVAASLLFVVDAVKAQTGTWSFGSNYTYFGNPSIINTSSGKYAVLQDNTVGNTLLNSPNSIYFRINNVTKMFIGNNGNISIGPGETNPTAKLQLPANDGTANMAPLKFINGTLTAIPESGAIEFSGGIYYASSGTLRSSFAFLESPTFTGTPSAPTAAVNTNTTQLATTAFVQAAKSGYAPWPANPGQFVYFGNSALNQANAGNYALLQGNINPDPTQTGNTFLNSPTNIYFRINNTDKMFLRNDGYFGIGTLIPGAQLDVHNTGIFNGQTISIGASTGLDIERVYLSYDSQVATGRLMGQSNVALSFGTNNVPDRLIINHLGNVGIGTTRDGLLSNPNNYKLAVNGIIGARAVKVEVSSTTWSDYVFEKDYKMKSIKELEEFVKTNKHLPNVPSACEVENNGIDLATMDATLLAKIEELALYIIEQNKKLEAQNARIEALEKN